MKLSEKYKDKFASQIIGRGTQYFKSGVISKCFKTEDEYISKVAGSYGEEYTIKIKAITFMIAIWVLLLESVLMDSKLNR